MARPGNHCQFSLEAQAQTGVVFDSSLEFKEVRVRLCSFVPCGHLLCSPRPVVQVLMEGAHSEADLLFS